MQTYKFNFYRAAKFVRSVRAYSVPDAVAMIPEFTDAKIHGLWTHAHQWIGLEALELIIEIEATKPVETKCPATYDVTGGHMQRTYVRFEDLDGKELERREYAGHVSRTPIVSAAEKRLPTCRNVRFSYGTMKTGRAGDRWQFREVQCGI